MNKNRRTREKNLENFVPERKACGVNKEWMATLPIYIQ